MQDTPDISVPSEQPDTDPVRRLLVALGEWGVAEVQGESEPVLEQLKDEANDAYKDVAAVA